ncbi:MAG: hypothetical protein PSV17_08195 [Methylotenera sp.]|uniref:hypothetical protein n=1 Tax=Methylotenera sp. TaxID=2051956 RepID=UPI002487AC21|nr:hypothetical protein [Methylotenera sp.]MDI1309401.1 hypothetical protein [Methylotenera sp.]
MNISNLAKNLTKAQEEHLPSTVLEEMLAKRRETIAREGRLMPECGVKYFLEHDTIGNMWATESMHLSGSHRMLDKAGAKARGTAPSASWRTSSAMELSVFSHIIGWRILPALHAMAKIAGCHDLVTEYETAWRKRVDTADGVYTVIVENHNKTLDANASVLVRSHLAKARRMYFDQLTNLNFLYIELHDQIPSDTYLERALQSPPALDLWEQTMAA